MLIARACDDFVASLLAQRGFSENTARAYATDLHNFTLYAHQARVEDCADISLELLRDWLWHLSEEGLAKASLARRAAAVRSFTKWMRSTAITDTDIGARLKAPKADSSLPRVVSSSALEDIFELLSLRASEGEPVALRDLAIIEVLYASGMRVSELVGLETANLNLDRQTCLLYTSPSPRDTERSRMPSSA